MTENEQNHPQEPLVSETDVPIRSQDPLVSEQDPFSAAANLFGIYSPPFFELVDSLSTGQLRRLVKALVSYPLNDKEYLEADQPRTIEAYKIGDRLIKSRTLMEMQVMMDAEKAKKEEQDSLKEKENDTSTNQEN